MAKTIAVQKLFCSKCNKVFNKNHARTRHAKRHPDCDGKIAAAAAAALLTPETT